MNTAIMKEIFKRIDYLKRLNDDLDKATPDNVNGRLRISESKYGTRYYQVLPGGDNHGKYLRKSEIHKIQALAQKGYIKEAKRRTQEELDYLHFFISNYPENTFDDLYPSLHASRKKLVDPVRLPDDIFISKWLSQEYQRLGFSDNETSSFYTGKGIRVRSKSEILIADKLDTSGIPFLIEYPLYLSGYGWVYPDFMILDIRDRSIKFWEHHGMMDDKEYVNNSFLSKTQHYIANGYFPGVNLIQTFESSKYPLSTKIIDDYIKKYLL